MKKLVEILKYAKGFTGADSKEALTVGTFVTPYCFIMLMLLGLNSIIGDIFVIGSVLHLVIFVYMLYFVYKLYALFKVTK